MADNSIALSRAGKVFVAKETTSGTLEYPDINDLIIPAGEATIKQAPTYTESKEKKNSRDVIDRFVDMQGAGEWTIPMYARPADSAGSKPLGAVLYESLMGTETVGGSDVVYSQALTKPSFSIFVLKDHSMFFGYGATVGKASASLTTKGPLEVSFSGQFMVMGWAGTSATTAAVAAADTTVSVEDAKSYTVNSKIFLGADTGTSGAGYTVTAIDTSTDVVTFTPAAVTGCASGDYVTPWEPTGVSTTPASSVIEPCGSSVTIDTVSTPIKSFSVDITDQPEYLADEVTSACAPQEYAEAKRNITGKMDVYFREQDIVYFYDGKNTVKKSITLVAGDTAGNRMKIAMPYSILEVPDITGAENTVALSMNLTALGSSGEDSCTITFD